MLVTRLVFDSGGLGMGGFADAELGLGASGGAFAGMDNMDLMDVMDGMDGGEMRRLLVTGFKGLNAFGALCTPYMDRVFRRFGF